MSRIFYLHLGPWTFRLKPGPIWETRSSFHWKYSQIQSLGQEILLAHNWNVHNFIQTKDQQLFTPARRSTSQGCWQDLILAPLGQLSFIYPTRPNLQASSASMRIQKPSGPHHSSQLHISFHFPEAQRRVSYIWSIVEGFLDFVFCFLFYFCYIFIICLLGGKRVEWSQNINFQSHSDMLLILQKPEDCSVSPPSSGPWFFLCSGHTPLLLPYQLLKSQLSLFFFKNFSIIMSTLCPSPSTDRKCLKQSLD